jgi:hypothetical protein
MHNQFHVHAFDVCNRRWLPAITEMYIPRYAIYSCSSPGEYAYICGVSEQCGRAVCNQPASPLVSDEGSTYLPGRLCTHGTIPPIHQGESSCINVRRMQERANGGPENDKAKRRWGFGGNYKDCEVFDMRWLQVGGYDTGGGA